eukprot:2445370-Pyramimonas_sp.AAC.1
MAPHCSTDGDDTYGLNVDEHGHHIQSCLAADVSRVILSELRRKLSNVDRVTTMRVHVAAAAKRAVV